MRIYRFGFNGKEKVDEVYGDANAYDFGARLYDPRIGRWLAVDPLAMKYPFVSPYVFTLNSPLIFVDPDGRVVEYANAETEKVVKEAMDADPEFAKTMLKLEKSDVVYEYAYKGSTNYMSSSGHNDDMGNFTTDGNKVLVNFESNEASVDNGKFTTLYHETEHAVQFEHGEIGFEKKSGKWVTGASYDINDEVKAFEAGLKAPGVRQTLKESFEKKSPEEKINTMAKKSAQYNLLKQRANEDTSSGKSVDRNNPVSPTGKQQTVKNNTLFYRTKKERE
jgi:RHS repeat-associated protein